MNNTAILLGGGLLALYFLNKKPTKSTSQTKTIKEFEKTEEENSEEKPDEIYEISEPENSEEQKLNEINVPSEDPKNSGSYMGTFVPGSQKSGSLQKLGSFGIKQATLGSVENRRITVRRITTNKSSGAGKSQLGSLKGKEVPATQKIIIKSKPTPGYFYRPTKWDGYYEDPLLKIAVTAYELYNIPDNVILTYSNQINKHPYNIRFQHVASKNYLPYNKRVDVSAVYGTLEEQVNNPEQGSIREGWEYPVIYLPTEEEFI